MGLVMLLPFSVKGQQGAGDSTRVTNYFPTGLRIATDAIALIKTSYDDSYSGWELNFDVDVSRYFLVVDIGGWKRDLRSDLGQYDNEGNYFRLGADFNFLHRGDARNALFMGFRYARASFSENLATTIEDPVWGSEEISFTNSDAKARWLELTAGLKVKIWKILWLGYTARLKFGLNTSNTSQMVPYDIPGYGQNEKRSTWGFNYQLMIRIPIRTAGSEGDKQ